MRPLRVLNPVVRALLVAALFPAVACERSERAPAGESEGPREAAIENDPAPDTNGGSWFVEAAAERGLDFVHRSGHHDRYFIPEITVGGAALLDMDGDGFLDVYLVQSGALNDHADIQPANRLYRNRGDGTFQDVTAGSGAGDRGYGCGVATGDFDGDGDVDLYVTNVGPNVLLRNDGSGRFSDVTAEAGVGNKGFSTSAAFVDYDKDGDLDLLVLNYLVWSVQTERNCENDLGELDYCAPKAYKAPALNVLYRNDGNGTFTDVTAEAGLGSAVGTSLGVVCGDFNGDGLVDLFVANDGMNDRLWINLGDGRFEDRATLAGCALDQEGIAKAGMGVTAADIDDDGDLDLMVCNLVGESDSLFRNEGDFFADATAMAGLAATSRAFTRFGMAWVDFDNDGYLDLFQANGRVARQTSSYRPDDPYAEPNLLLRGGPGGRFTEITPRGGTKRPLVATSRAAAFGDIDNDGRVDILVVNRDGPVQLLGNVVRNPGHWIIFRVIDAHGSDAIGATVTMTLGARSIRRDVRTAYSYCAANDPRVHVGLGASDHVVEVIVRWPDGVREGFPDIGRVDVIVTLQRGEGAPAPP